MAELALQRKDFASALSFLLPLVTRKEAAAFYYLGQMTLRGEGVRRDPYRALKLFKRAARRGEPRAMNNIGFIKLHGLAGKANAAEARKWFERAAKKGLSAAQNNLGLLLTTGVGGHKNPARALAFFKMAAEQDYPSAQHNLGILIYSGLAGEKNIREAFLWIQKAALAGHEPSISFLIRSYSEGLLGLPQDQAQVRYWQKNLIQRKNSKIAHDMVSNPYDFNPLAEPEMNFAAMRNSPDTRAEKWPRF